MSNELEPIPPAQSQEVAQRDSAEPARYRGVQYATTPAASGAPGTNSEEWWTYPWGYICTLNPGTPTARTLVWLADPRHVGRGQLAYPGGGMPAGATVAAVGAGFLGMIVGGVVLSLIHIPLVGFIAAAAAFAGVMAWFLSGRRTLPLEVDSSAAHQLAEQLATLARPWTGRDGKQHPSFADSNALAFADGLMKALAESDNVPGFLAGTDRLIAAARGALEATLPTFAHEATDRHIAALFSTVKPDPLWLADAAYDCEEISGEADAWLHSPQRGLLDGKVPEDMHPTDLLRRDRGADDGDPEAGHWPSLAQ